MVGCFDLAPNPRCRNRAGAGRNQRHRSHPARNWYQYQTGVLRANAL